LQGDFQKLSHLLVQCVRSWPYSTYKNRDSLKIRLNEVDYVLQRGKHYQILESIV